ncbi:Ig-like domain-containing protein [Bifidobacterium eulemuris]|uniref:ATPase AAA n=1 Tax=Bifidobacterium eulemuris TaxID=1765219 RepID=A0A261GB20_9BIFI|nr:Ig-like domain-containing protein [Bifidobacterium eulemuris]OZG68618.1 ATPase AAA [Bifidobacterium eulemuris]QOL32739.1 fibronectin type III domain-containing protein [Bifidobacterium eulemuris]
MMTRRHRIRDARRRLFSIAASRWTLPAVALVAMLALAAGAIIISSVTRQHVRLDDGTVWVSSLTQGAAARFNVRNREADASVPASAARFDIIQHDGVTILTEPGRLISITASTVSTGAVVDTSSAAIAAIGGDVIAILNTMTGDVWAGTTTGLDALTPNSEPPCMRLGSGGRIAVDANGHVYGYRPKDGMVLRLDSPDGGEPEQLASLTGGRFTHADGFTVIDGVPVIVTGGTVLFPHGSAVVDDAGTLALQSPPSDGRQHGWVAAASDRGLAIIDLDSADPTPLVFRTGGRADAARPAAVAGCVYAAWSQNANNYLRWCAPDADYDSTDLLTLESVRAGSELVFRTNHRLVVLNDVTNGTVWNTDGSTAAVTIQWDAMRVEEAERERGHTGSADNHREFSTVCSAQSERFAAVDDEFGVRAGGSRIIDVLRNDELGDCSVLRITTVGTPDHTDVSVHTVYDGRYLQVDAAGATAGTARFRYDISDGRGQTASATVVVAIAGTGNHAPVQSDMPPHIDVEQGATYTTDALAGFIDPDGDPMTLTSAVTPHTDQVAVSIRADGQLVFDAGSLSSGRVGVEVTVSDGRSTGTGIVYFSVKPANTLAAVIDPVVRQTTPNTDTTIDLTPYVHGTSSQPARLTQADSLEDGGGAHVEARADDMSLVFRASGIGTHYVSYTITQGMVPAIGLVRVEVSPATAEHSEPTVANDVTTLASDLTAIVEPLANDADPMGGVLAVTEVHADEDSGITAAMVGNKRVYLTARQAPTTPVSISYTAANAAGTATGVIVALPPIWPTAARAPKADDIVARVRTGGIITVDVLDHVTAADNTSVRVRDDLRVDEAAFRGLAFVSDGTVRYQASGEPGVYDIIYTVEDASGNTASATITVAVHARDAASKAVPTPRAVEAQAAAGRRTRIPIDLVGIDGDGDDVQLLGLGNTAPRLGRIVEVGSDFMVYEAYADSRGTDVFTYAVEDWTGQRAQARIRVGVFHASTGSGVMARDDAVTLRPNTSVAVPVTHNDIAGDDAELAIDPRLDAQGVEDARVDGDLIAFTAPSQPGTAHIAYTVVDKAGLRDTGTLHVTVDPNTDIESPTAYDYRVPSAATIDKRSVDVDVSAWIANPSGSVDDLRVDVHASARNHARLTGGEGSTTIRVDLTDEARAVPYTVTNTAYGITATAFIHVPAYGVFPPTPRPKAPPLTVNAGEFIDIAIADYVRVGAGKRPYVADVGSVSATKAADGDLLVDDETLRFTALTDYAGPASITFTAVDGRGGADSAIINSAVITLPITVIGRDAPAPTFSSATIEVEAGADATVIDLTALTRPTDDSTDGGRRYSYSGAPTSDESISATVTATGSLRVRAVAAAKPGTTAFIPIAIGYARGTVHAGMTVRVVASTKPLARIGNTTVQIRAGSNVSVDLLSEAYNPFPDTALRAVSCTDSQDSVITVECAPSGVIDIHAAADTGASATTVLVTVRDATDTREREVTAGITVTIVDKPEAPLLSPVAGTAENGRVTLRWTPGSANGEAVDEYRVSWSGGGTGERLCGTATQCVVDGLVNGRRYIFTVAAHNAVGWSGESHAVAATPDTKPSAPTEVAVIGGHRQAKVRWSAPEGDFTAVTGYTVTLTLSNGHTLVRQTNGLSHTFVIDNERITDGVTATATVTAANAIGDGPASAPSSPSVVWGTPDGIDGLVSATQDERNADSVTVGLHELPDMRNAGCEALRFTVGQASAATSCETLSTSLRIASSDFGRRLDATVTVVPKRSGVDAPAASVTVTPVYTPSPPSEARVIRDEGVCTVSARSSDPTHNDGMLITRHGVPITGFSYSIDEWDSCGSVEVRQVFRGQSSDAVTASNTDVWKVVPVFRTDYRPMWSGRNRLVFHPDAMVNAWGQPVTATIMVMRGGDVIASTDSPRSLDSTIALDLPDASDESLTWAIKLTADEPILRAEARGVVSRYTVSQSICAVRAFPLSKGESDDWPEQRIPHR